MLRDKGLEKQILACLLTDSSCLNNDEVKKLDTNDFQYEEHRIIFQTIKELGGNGGVDTTLLISSLKEQNKLVDAGGAYEVSGIIGDTVPIVTNLSLYVNKLLEISKKHNNMKAVNDVYNSKLSIEELGKVIAAERDIEYPQSDSGNAEIFKNLFQYKAKFDHSIGKWKIWDGNMWVIDDSKGVFQYGIDVARARQKNALTFADSQQKSDHFKFGVLSENVHKIKSMLEIASGLEGLSTSAKDWNNNPSLFQMKNGVFDLEKQKFMPGNPEWMICQSSDIIYDKEEECPQFDKFLEDIMNGDPKMVDFLVRVLGYSLSGHTDEQCMFLLVGDGANGKSVLLQLMNHLLGDYHQNSRFDAFLHKSNHHSSHDIARLYNSRVVTANESGASKRWDVEKIKEITGGDIITARPMYKESFTYKSIMKLWCATNELPKVDDFSHAFWRRIKVIPFTRRFDGKDRDPDILNKLKTESSGILNKLFHGFADWRKEGLKEPEIVSKAVNHYRTDSDEVALFVAECLVKGRDNKGEVTSTSLYKTFKEWWQNNYSERCLSQIAFGRRMNQLGYKSEKIGGQMKYLGLIIRTIGQ